MGEEQNRILARMLERLFAGLVSGPNLNCRPHSSRQRIDLTQLQKLKSLSAEETLSQLLGAKRSVKLTAEVPPPKRRAQADQRKSAAAASESEAAQPSGDEFTPEERAEQQAWSDQQWLLGKLRIVADEAKAYEQDTGVHVLNVGFPLLSLPPGTTGSFGSSGGRSATKRILAPLAFIPVAITIRSGPTPTIEIACKSDEVDVVAPNTALLAWLEQQTGIPAKDAFEEDQSDPWREIRAITEHVANLLKLPRPVPFADAASRPERWQLQPAPRADDQDARPALVSSAVLGLFPMNNQSLLRDMQAMVAGEALQGPVESFIQAGIDLDQPVETTFEHDPGPTRRRARAFADERLVTACDPCQSRAVRLSRECRGLVIHGPPGTGKSQTITNIIGDHLSRGERVLMVCDKRTALDVVANRLAHLELGQLGALIHDPQRDQRDLYRAIREQLEQLVESKTDSAAERKLKKIDADLQRLHDELSQYSTLLMEKDARGSSFHELVGQWFEIPDADELGLDPAEITVDLAQFEDHREQLTELFERAEEIGYADHAWKACAGVELGTFLAQPLDHWRGRFERCLAAAQAADQTANPAIPPFAPQRDLAAQSTARAALAEQLQDLLRRASPHALTRWAGQGVDAVRRAQQKLAEAAQYLEILRSGPLETALPLAARAEALDIAVVNRQLTTIDDYRDVASKWYRLLCWQRRAAAAEVLSRYGLSLRAASVERIHAFLTGRRARLVLQALLADLLGYANVAAEPISDEELDRSLSELQALIELLHNVHQEPALDGVSGTVAAALGDPEMSATLLGGLRDSLARAAALIELKRSLIESGLFSEEWLQRFMRQLCNGGQAEPTLSEVEADFDGLEMVLRLRSELSQLPDRLQHAASCVLDRPVAAKTAIAALRKAALAGAISQRVRSHAALQAFDAKRLESNLARYRTLEQEKRTLVADLIMHRWVSQQKERLLSSTGSRLNSIGADLRRRLTMRGVRAMRLRQVISVGQGIEGGDPLFDLRPLWMASPETVAQIFPRLSLFDVVIFDEASQCRLEEALPVLTRAGRVVIAGDPQQLPPTRFFESAVAVSEDETPETEQQLFETHQTSVEDLLTAALGISIQQCYLDVHYRSRNADLVEFSNQQFYSSRLQPIPGHPANRLRFAPITLYHTPGVYSDRMNIAEAEQVCQIVHDLLKRAEPPSIGIACFNVAQRDLIAEQLDSLAAEDDEFADRLSLARVRRGEGSFEGLFVKNLENVQGDERDYIVISTTYGPDPKGRFYRRFGPLGRSGGGRRLNVLVTRARQEVHLVTSIPPDVYRGIPPIPAGQSPTGGWLLFAYLAYAEQLAAAYEDAHRQLTEVEGAAALPDASVNVWPSQSPSTFIQTLADRLATDHQLGSDVYWGNEGFCVDLALRHPRRAEDVTIGVLCDIARFSPAEDPLEWDLFRTAVLEGQGWHLHRIWTPHFFRDPRGCTRAALRKAAALAAKTTPA